MSKKIFEIYTEYKIMPNLQDHMFRVAAVASLICDNFNELLPKENIITACLLHDMGNILKFNLEIFPEFLKPNGLNYWQDVQKEYEEKYGKDEYLASYKIAQELKVSNEVLVLIKAISFLGAQESVQGKDFSKKIVEYCDDRVNPFGVVSLEQRLIDLRKRKHYSPTSGDRDIFDNIMRIIEKQIFSKCKIKPEDINDETVKSVILNLRDFVIK